MFLRLGSLLSKKCFLKPNEAEPIQFIDTIHNLLNMILKIMEVRIVPLPNQSFQYGIRRRDTKITTKIIEFLSSVSYINMLLAINNPLPPLDVMIIDFSQIGSSMNISIGNYQFPVEIIISFITLPNSTGSPITDKIYFLHILVI